jgi:hypothetical protein
VFQKSRPKADSPNSWTLTADSKALRQGKKRGAEAPQSEATEAMFT